MGAVGETMEDEVEAMRKSSFPSWQGQSRSMSLHIVPPFQLLSFIDSYFNIQQRAVSIEQDT